MIFRYLKLIFIYTTLPLSLNCDRRLYDERTKLSKVNFHQSKEIWLLPSVMKFKQVVTELWLWANKSQWIFFPHLILLCLVPIHSFNSYKPQKCYNSPPLCLWVLYIFFTYSYLCLLPKPQGQNVLNQKLHTMVTEMAEIDKLRTQIQDVQVKNVFFSCCSICLF